MADQPGTMIVLLALLSLFSSVDAGTGQGMHSYSYQYLLLLSYACYGARILSLQTN